MIFSIFKERRENGLARYVINPKDKTEEVILDGLVDAYNAFIKRVSITFPVNTWLTREENNAINLLMTRQVRWENMAIAASKKKTAEEVQDQKQPVQCDGLEEQHQ